MADAKITDLVALTGATLASTDVFPVVDVSATTAGSKKITAAEAVIGLSALGLVTGPASATDNAIARFDGTTGKLVQNSAATVADTTGALALLSDSATIALGASSNVILAWDAANTLALRNSTNAQMLKIYNTYTSSTNNEGIDIGFDANNAYIRSFKGSGGGAIRRLNIDCNDAISFRYNGSITWSIWSDTNIYPNTTNTSDIGSTGNRVRNMFSQTMNFVEMSAPAAPSSDQVVIFAQDNGSGKTQLMARFATGAAQQIAIEP